MGIVGQVAAEAEAEAPLLLLDKALQTVLAAAALEF
jgi:hypothetical protein